MTIISSGHSGETWWGWRVTVESCCYLDSSPGSLSHFRRWVGKLLKVSCWLDPCWAAGWDEWCLSVMNNDHGVCLGTKLAGILPFVTCTHECIESALHVSLIQILVSIETYGLHSVNW